MPSSGGWHWPPLSPEPKPEPKDEPHEHVASYETATRPDRNGHMVVTEHCECGHVVGKHDDWIL